MTYTETDDFTDRHLQDRYVLRDYGTHCAIIKTMQSGNSLQNEYGGYPVVSVGQKGYILRHFNALRARCINYRKE